MTRNELKTRCYNMTRNFNKRSKEEQEVIGKYIARAGKYLYPCNEDDYVRLMHTTMDELAWLLDISRSMKGK